MEHYMVFIDWYMGSQQLGAGLDRIVAYLKKYF